MPTRIGSIEGAGTLGATLAERTNELSSKPATRNTAEATATQTKSDQFERPLTVVLATSIAVAKGGAQRLEEERTVFRETAAEEEIPRIDGTAELTPDCIEGFSAIEAMELFPYLYLGAVRCSGTVLGKTSQATCAFAYGLGLEGRLQLLGVELRAENSCELWEQLLSKVVHQGVSGVKLAIAGPDPYLGQVFGKYFPHAQLQCCIEQLTRLAALACPVDYRRSFAREFISLFRLPTQGEAQSRLELLSRWMKTKAPEAWRSIEGYLENALHFYSFPKTHWPRIKMLRGLSHLKLEIERRLRLLSFLSETEFTNASTSLAIAESARWAERQLFSPFVPIESRSNMETGLYQ